MYRIRLSQRTSCKQTKPRCAAPRGGRMLPSNESFPNSMRSFVFVHELNGDLKDRGVNEQNWVEVKCVMQTIRKRSWNGDRLMWRDGCAIEAAVGERTASIRLKEVVGLAEPAAWIIGVSTASRRAQVSLSAISFTCRRVAAGGLRRTRGTRRHGCSNECRTSCCLSRARTWSTRWGFSRCSCSGPACRTRPTGRHCRRLIRHRSRRSRRQPEEHLCPPARSVWVAADVRAVSLTAAGPGPPRPRVARGSPPGLRSTCWRLVPRTRPKREGTRRWLSILAAFLHCTPSEQLVTEKFLNHIRVLYECNIELQYWATIVPGWR